MIKPDKNFINNKQKQQKQINLQINYEVNLVTNVNICCKFLNLLFSGCMKGM
jgi:hypothetical protein